MSAPKSSPWGKPDDVEAVAPGVWWVSTPSHGGFKLEPNLNKRVPDYMRKPGGWYEEDLDWAIVATVFPDLFSEKERASADHVLLNWMPAQYERFYGVTLEEGASMKRDEEMFRERHKNDMVVISASGDWLEGVPKGMVLVTAARGGRRADHSLPDEIACFLVPDAEYSSERRPWGDFVVDEARHERVECPP